MKSNFLPFMLLLVLIDTGYCLQCYSCVNSTGQLYSPAQCNSIQVNYTCVAPNDTCLNVRAKFTENDDETEVQLKECVTADGCQLKGNKICTKSEGKCEYTCCQRDLCNDGNPGNGRLAALRCFHCEDPHSSTDFVFNHSTPVNQSFTRTQCEANQTKMYCSYGEKCVKGQRAFQQSDDSEQFYVERRSCISNATCLSLQMLCNGTRSIGNATSQCWDRCCDRHFCNSASYIYSALSLIVLATILDLISV